MSCPLCCTSSSIIIRQTSLSELRERWLSSFGFDPFPKNYSANHIDKKRCSSCHLEYFDPPLYGDADFYGKISKYPWYYEKNKWEYDVAAEITSRLMPDALLEIGCGNGYFLEKIAPLGLISEGVDINMSAVDVCKAKGLRVSGDSVFELTKSYDMVVLFEVLEHMENAKELFEYFTSRLIRPGGHLIIAVPNPDGYLKELGINLLDMPPHHNSSWGVNAFEHLNSQFGLQLIEYTKEPIRYVHYLCLLQGILNHHAELTSTTWKLKVFYKLQLLIIKLLSPLTYLRDRERIDGQTHLVVFKNVR